MTWVKSQDLGAKVILFLKGRIQKLIRPWKETERERIGWGEEDFRALEGMTLIAEKNALGDTTMKATMKAINMMEATEAREKEVIAGTVIRRIFFAPDTNYVVFRLRSPAYADPVTCVGHLPPYFKDIDVDIQVEVYGKWETSKYGRQFRFQKIVIAGEDEFSFFIRQIKGLGPKVAENIKATFSKAELISILEHHPERLLEVPGIGPKKLDEILQSWNKAKKFRDLYLFFERAGAADKISTSLLIKIYNFFEEQGLDPVEVIQRNPYLLTQIRGIGFKTADKIALALGFSPKDERRLHAGIIYTLSKSAEEEGHTFLLRDQIKEAVFRELYTEGNRGEGEEKEAVQPSEVAVVLDGLLSRPMNGLISHGEMYGLKVFYQMEHWVYSRVFEMAQTSLNWHGKVSEEEVFRHILAFEEANGFTLTAEQRKFLFEAISGSRRVFGLVGYAGTGKTTVLKAFLDILTNRLKLVQSEEVVCCAFTGMAARRLREVTGFPYCRTIHSLLEFRNGRFQRDRDYPLTQRVVILDEASMVNLPLFYFLLRALRGDVLFIIVGDPAQLPPIGAGNVFSDLVFTGVLPHVKLTEIKRQASDSVITLVANEVRRGVFPQGYLHGEWRDFTWHEIEGEDIWRIKRRGGSQREVAEARQRNNERIRNAVLSVIRNLIQEGFSEWQVQVLSPMRIGLLGTTSLNLTLREFFNPPSLEKFEIEARGLKFRQGDKVVNLENRDLSGVPADIFYEVMKHSRDTSSFLSTLELYSSSYRVLNGQLGRLVGYFPETGQIAIHMFDVEEYVVICDASDLGRRIDLAYCLTVHKAQGSQYPFVVIPLTTSHWHMLNNQWLYTALTRAYSFCWLIGERAAFKRAATNTEAIRRQTWLSLATHSKSRQGDISKILASDGRS